MLYILYFIMFYILYYTIGRLYSSSCLLYYTEASNGKIIVFNEMEKKAALRNWRKSPRIISHCSRCLGSDSWSGPTEYEAVLIDNRSNEVFCVTATGKPTGKQVAVGQCCFKAVRAECWFEGTLNRGDTVNGGEWWASRFSRFTSGKRPLLFTSAVVRNFSVLAAHSEYSFFGAH
jgi:hypothetical protein